MSWRRGWLRARTRTSGELKAVYEAGMQRVKTGVCAWQLEFVDS